jgi:flagellin
MLSVQTNVTSLVAQENLRVDTNFQSRTIQRLTSGYRINSSGDDPAGLAVANGYRNAEAELTQGIQNANDGISTLQIIDGGLNNIGQILDRLKTLATQSASDTFTGDRNVLNSEFQGLVQEINRQAQSIGLDQNGTFARSLSVYIGGGRAHGANTAATNSSLQFDLSAATVDAKSLGLTGMQAIGGTEGTTDIGNGSPHTSVSAIINDANNTTASTGWTVFYFAGSGFSGSDAVAVSVNTQSVSDVNTLVTAINSAIENAGNNGTAAATAFKNANIRATVNTDSTGKSQLAFTSSTTAFQVQAGDMVSNALMGNFADASSSADSAALTSTVAGKVNALDGDVTGAQVKISGAGMESPVTLTLGADVTVAAAVSDLTTQIAQSSALTNIGLTVAVTGGKLTFSSATGEKFQVEVNGDTHGYLGMGSFTAADDTTFTGTHYDNSAAYGTTNVEISLNGGDSSGNLITVDLNAGDATAATKASTGTSANVAAAVGHNNLTINVDGAGAVAVDLTGAVTMVDVAAKINATAGLAGIASVSSADHLVLTSTTKGAHSSIVVAGSAGLADLGLGASAVGKSRTAASVASDINNQIAANSTLAAAGLTAVAAGTDGSAGTATITIKSLNPQGGNTGVTLFRIDAYGGTYANVGFGVAGKTFTGLTVSNATDYVVNAGGASSTGALGFTGLTLGNDSQAVTISATDTSGALQSKTITLTNNSTLRNGDSIDDAINAINTALQQTNNTTLQKIVAVKDNSGGTEKIDFISSLASFQVSIGSTASGNGLSGQGTTVFSAALAGGSSLDIATQQGATDAISALTTAVSALGSAQANVGKAQNTLNYAIGLAQSQMANLSAAESRIRDADMAAEAANLTKAQVLQQSAIAAMVQANSAPQAVLTLLRG